MSNTNVQGHNKRLYLRSTTTRAGEEDTIYNEMNGKIDESTG